MWIPKAGGGLMNDNQRTVLCVDDEHNILNSIKRLVRREDYRVLAADSGQAGLDILSENDVHVVISDQRMPGMNGTEFLKKVKELYPEIIRIILTGYTEVDSITEAINEGSVYKFFLKPWNDQTLKLEIRRALDQYDLILANKHLHDKVIAKNNELASINENLEAKVRERTKTLEVQNQALQLSQAVLEEVPLPILGISSEMIIVLANRAAKALDLCNHPIGIGEQLNKYFTESTIERLIQRLSGNEALQMECEGTNQARIKMESAPLSGSFKGQGLILTFLQTASAQAV